MKREVTILTGEPTVEVIAEMRLEGKGILNMAHWVKEHRPECMPDEWEGADQSIWDLFPHPDWGGPNKVSDNELLVELAGRKCYDSFGLKAGKKTNAEYIANTQSGEIPHASILYHAKMSFFFAGISRRVSHEIIRNYVGADRDEEGAPSQESTRFTHHYGFFVCPPRYLTIGDPRDQISMQGHFQEAMERAYRYYLAAVDMETAQFIEHHNAEPKGIDKKRIYEAASSFLPHQAETSMIWSTNPAAISKFIKERSHEAADLEIQRFARKWKRICVERWPNLFPQKFMREGLL